MTNNKFLMKTVKIMSKTDIKMDKNYKLYRKIYEFIHPALNKNHFDYNFLIDDKSVPVRFFYPNNEKLFNPIIIYFHGGGWVTGNINTYNDVCATLANKTNHLVISVNYRLAPEYPFPIGLEDCYDVVKLIVKNHKNYGIKNREICLMGDSAGANIAAAISLMARDKKEFKIYNQILLYPVLYNDHTESSKYNSIRTNGKDYFLTSKLIVDYEKLYISDKYKNSPYYAPLLAKHLFNQPRTLIITADLDPLRDEGKDYSKRLKRYFNYVEYYNMKNSLHGFLSSTIDKHTCEKTYKYINRFLGEDNEKK